MKYKISVLLFLSTIISTCFSRFQADTSDTFEMMMGFMSIIIGFSVTALSIVATSNFSKTLYKIEDKTDNSKTLLHNLVDVFKTSTGFFIVNIISIFVYSIFSNDWLIKTNGFIPDLFELPLNKVSVANILQALIWSLLVISIFEFYHLFKLFCNYVIQNSK